MFLDLKILLIQWRLVKNRTSTPRLRGQALSPSAAPESKGCRHGFNFLEHSNSTTLNVDLKTPKFRNHKLIFVISL